MMADWLENITDKDALQNNLTFASIYIAIYEYMTDYIVSTVKDFLCNIGIQDGKETCDETSVYRKEIKIASLMIKAIKIKQSHLFYG